MVIAAVLWAIAFAFGWLWWRYFRRGVVYSPGGKFTRKHDPFNYWFAMVLFGTAIAVFAFVSFRLTVFGPG
jgi:hypothetical protein